MTNKTVPEGTTLGIDLGPNSVGWALISKDVDKGGRIVALGTRVFKAGLDDLEVTGRGKPRNAGRREARSRRRLLDRHRRRMAKLANILKNAGLLPEGRYTDSEERHNLLKDLDERLASPYQLRTKALDESLTPFELGRALYHLAQRRGFLSNRIVTKSQEDEEKGVVKPAIGELAKAIEASGSRSLGEYFSKVDARTERIRGKYTSRKMYQDEFELIWQSQSKHHSDRITPELKKAIYEAIFYQRPLKSQARFIGECELELSRKRAPWALLSAQRFRYLQTVNNLTVIDKNSGEVLEMSEVERETLIGELEKSRELTFGKIRKLLSLGRRTMFNLEQGGEKRILGNKIAAQLVDVFGEDRWTQLSPADQDSVVEDLRCIVKDEALIRRGMKAWGLDESAAVKLSQVRLEPEYCRFSRQAIAKLVPLLSKGVSLQTVIKKLYPEQFSRQGESLDKLPPVESEEMPDLRNPIVERTLTELRRIVNALIKQYGKPDRIRIELGRDLRQSATQRERTSKRMRENEKKRSKAAELILQETGNPKPSRSDIEKAMLFEECDRTCPYTDKTISPSDLFGPHPQFDIEHIIPFERSLDDSFLNKTLCDATENRQTKHNHTPYEAYKGTDQWEDILGRVNRFKGDAAGIKLQRFKATPEEVEEMLESFTARQLNDMRWASKWAKQYLGLLYGGVNSGGVDARGKRCVQATAGGVTAFLRNSWELNGILGDGPGKSRDDHRHHAIDAIVVALTDSGAIKKISSLARQGRYNGRGRFDDLPLPWAGFHDEVAERIDQVVASHRVSRRVRGALHEETFYGKPREDDCGKRYVHIRKPLEALSEKDIPSIVDPVIRRAVQTKLQELGEKPAAAFKLAKMSENAPTWKTGDGRLMPVLRTRIRQNLHTFPVGRGKTKRWVKTGRNHHMEVVELLDVDGNTIKWDGYTVSMYEAHQRQMRGEPIVRRQFGPGTRFLFSIATGELLQLENDKGMREQVVVRSVETSRNIRWMKVNDARLDSKLERKGRTAGPNALQRHGCRKVVATPLGEVRRARD